MQAASEFFHRLGTRRTLISAFILVILFGAITATNTFTSSTPKAQAGNCFTQDQAWKLRGGDVPLTIGRAHFGATICLGSDGTIDSVSPFLNGGIEGAGTPAGFDFSNQGAWIHKQTDTYVEVRGRSQVKECLPGLRNVVCSLTDTETYTLRYTPQYGPYLPGTEPGIFTTSRTCTMGGGCFPGVTFVRQ